MTQVKAEDSAAVKKHICTVCGKHSDTVICHACEDKLRGEALERKIDVERHGK